MDYRGSIPDRGTNILLFTSASRPALEPTLLYEGHKRPGSEADHSPPANTEIKNAWTYISTLEYVFTAWYLVKHRDNFTLHYLYVRIGK
jgi:hypothetical protein